MNVKSANYVRDILKLAVPLMIANISMIGMGVVDTIMAGQAGADDLAGLAIGGNIWLVCEMTMWGIICAITPRVARFHGAKKHDEITGEAQQGIVLSTLLGVLAMQAALLFSPIIPHLGATPSVTEVAEGYIDVIAFSLPISGACWAVFAILEGHGMMKYVVWSSIVAVILNIIFDYIFVFGKLGAPAMGGVGCAWTTTIIYWLWGVSALWYLLRQKKLKRYKLLSNWSGIDWSRWKAIFALGLPISMAMLAEEGFFNMTTLMIAPLGTEALGAHQITIQILAVISMVGFGIGQSTAISVAQCIGRESFNDMFSYLKVGFGMVAGFSFGIGLIVFLTRDILPIIFTQNPTIAMISSAIMLMAPIYLLIDVTQIWAAQSLRGFEDTKVPMLILFVSYWLVGFPLGYSLAISDIWGETYGIYGFWLGLFAGVVFCGVLLALRLYTKSKRYHANITSQFTH